MAKDKVMSPPKAPSRAGGIKQIKTGIIEGPTAKGGSDNLNPYNRTNNKKK